MNQPPPSSFHHFPFLQMDLLSELPLQDLGVLHHYLVAAATAGSLLALSIAVAAAALGLWRIQSVRTESKHQLLLDERALKASDMPAVVAANVSVPTMNGAMLASDDDCLGTPRARFTAYYACKASAREEEEGGGEDREEEDDEGFCGQGDNEGFFGVVANEGGVADNGMFARKRCDLGWKRCEAFTEFEGSVVRLWGCDGAASPRGLRREMIRGKMGANIFC